MPLDMSSSQHYIKSHPATAKMLIVSQRAMRRSLPLTVLAICFILLAINLLHIGPSFPLSFRTSGQKQQHEEAKPRKIINRPALTPGTCLPQFEFIRRPKLELSDNVLYSRRCIRPVKGDFDRDDVTNISQPIVTDQTTVNLTSCSHDIIPPCESIPLHVPNAYPPKQYRNFIFGIATNYQRMNDSLPAIAHWLSGTGAQLIGVIVDAEDPKKHHNLTALEQMYADKDIFVTFKAPSLKANLLEKEKTPAEVKAQIAKENKKKSKSDLKPPEEEQPPKIPVEHHHFMLIRDLMQHKTKETTWLAVLDDDTFFPSLYTLDKALANYDPRAPHYLGALSDDFNNFRIWGFMAFGGAGVFVSLALAETIEPRLEQCIREASIQTGDGILRDCVYTHTRTKMTVVPGLNQQDVLGDVSGYFESGPNPLSLHHWKSWYQENIPAQAAVTKVCGGCYLQRFTFGDHTLFANGYSITQYHDGLNSIRLDRVEGTWEHPGHEYDHDYGPMRKKLPSDKKKSYRLKDSEFTGTGELRQIYVYKGNETAGEMDEVIEMLWESGR